MGNGDTGGSIVSPRDDGEQKSHYSWVSGCACVCVCAHTHACAHACMCTCVGEFERAKGSGAISSCIISEEKRKEDFKEVFFVRCKFNFF